MSSLRDIKNRINAISNTSSITQAMYNISASKIKQSTVQFENYQDFMLQLNSVFYGTGAVVGDHRLINPAGPEGKVYILITGDRGLAGGFHSQIFKFFDEQIRKDITNYKLLVIGKKGYYYAKKHGYEMVNENIISSRDEIELIDFRKEAKTIRNMFMNQVVSEIIVIYMHYVNGVVQRPKRDTILPIPVSGKAIIKSKSVDYSYDSNPVTMLESMANLHVESSIYGVIADSKLSEHSARMIAMQNATDNAKEIVKRLNMQYHRARQQKITNELIDIVNGSRI